MRKETCTIDSKSLKAVKDTVTTSCDKISKSSIKTERPNVKIPAKVKKLRNSNEGTGMILFVCRLFLLLNPRIV